MQKLNIKIHVQNRINDGGYKVDTLENAEEQKLIEKPEEWRIDEIIQMFYCNCINTTQDAVAEEEIQSFSVQFESIWNSLGIEEYNVNSTANCSILVRLINFNKFKIDG